MMNVVDVMMSFEVTMTMVEVVLLLLLLNLRLPDLYLRLPRPRQQLLQLLLLQHPASLPFTKVDTRN